MYLLPPEGAEHVVRDFPSSPSSVRAARDLVDEIRLPEIDRESARVVISELADNATRHAATPYTVRLCAEPAVITIEVGDLSALLPVLQPLDAAALCGRGLRIVDGFADEWGMTRSDGGGKMVWARLPRLDAMADHS